MATFRNFTCKELKPVDLLDGAKTLSQGSLLTCDWVDNWIPATDFSGWARQSLEKDCLYGWINAISHAKRAVCCRIDILLRYNHLVPFFSKKYPKKIDVLKQLGISIQDVVYSLVIFPRNELEHTYERPTKDFAKNAVGIAELFVSATEKELELSSVVGVNPNISSSRLLSSNVDMPASVSTFGGFLNHSMLFIDVFMESPEAKIIDPNCNEIRWSKLCAFSTHEAIELAKLLRCNYNYSQKYVSRNDKTYYQEMKKQGKF